MARNGMTLPDTPACQAVDDGDDGSLRNRLSAALKVLAGSRGHQAEEALRAWFDPLCLRREADAVVVRFPHPFFQAWFEPVGAALLREAIRRTEGESVGLRYDGHGAPPPPTPPSSPGEEGQASEGPMSDFSSFLAGAKNRFTLDTLQNIARGDALYTPVLIKGPPGTGKTHLLRALASGMSPPPAQGPCVACAEPDQALFLSGPDFAALFHQSAELAHRARQRLRRCVCLCVDDVHLLADDRQAQEELSCLLDWMTARRRILACGMVSSCGDPAGASSASVSGLKPELTTRLFMGMVLDLAEPDLDVRLRYAQTQLEYHELRVSRDTALLLARRCTDLRRLHGAVLRMAAFQRHTGQLPDDSDMDTIFRATGNANALTAEAVLAVVASHCGFTSRDLRGRKRDPKLVRARQVAMFLCRELLGESFPSLGRIFGGKDHSTVMHAVKKIRESQVTNKEVHILVTELTERCRQHAPE